ncbi:MAG: hypothetical protein KY467_15485 [Gemmatimonadetes bacterium]|nr:hypothetical protein [Gemmatimonadota bacterium]
MDGTTRRGFFEQSQLAVTLLTGIIGIWLTVSQHSMARRQAEIKETQDSISTRLSTLEHDRETVESVSKYFDLLTGTDTTKAKMGAYAVYMLKREDPEMVVSLIMAADKPSLRNSVLADLANRDPDIRAQLVTIALPGSDTAASAPPESQNVEAASIAQNVLTRVTRQGWAYAGVFRNNRWTHGPMFQVGSRLPRVGEELEVAGVRLYLRDAAPDSLTYRHGAVQGVLDAGQLVRIEQVRANLKSGSHVWVRVAVVDSTGR